MSRSRRRKVANRGPSVRKSRLAKDQYPELNATLYASNPAAYFRTRLQSLALLLSDSAGVDQALGEGLSYGALRLGAMRRASSVDVLRYCALDSTVISHHAGETLLRLYFAHIDNLECPWLEIAKQRNFTDFKSRVSHLATTPIEEWDRSQACRVFMGGVDPQDASVNLTAAEWESAADAILELLQIVADRLIRQNHLYNAAKHGLVGVPQEGGSLTFGKGEEAGIEIGGGPSVTYLHRLPVSGPGTHEEPDRWRATTEFAHIDADFMFTNLVVVAIASLWAVATRRYVGQPGRLPLLSHDEVLSMTVASYINSGHHARAISYSLPVEKLDDRTAKWKLQAAQIQIHAVRFGQQTFEAYDRVNGHEQDVKFVDLPLRPEDVRKKSESRQSLLPFSPSGSQVV